MARAALRMTVADVAKAADVAPNTIVRVEAGKSVNTGTTAAIRAVYEAAGVMFTESGESVGVLLKKSTAGEENDP